MRVIDPKRTEIIPAYQKRTWNKQNKAKLNKTVCLTKLTNSPIKLVPQTQRLRIIIETEQMLVSFILR